jgi:hypothetical protein
MPADSYRAGICNIGPDEIARRRRTGHTGVVISVALLALLLVSGAPPLARLTVFLPASLAAAGYLQAALRFCADYGWRGVFNFGAAGHSRVTSVVEAANRRADRARAVRLAAGSAAIGAAVALLSLAI